VVYARGLGVVRDDRAAVLWYQKAAAQGLAAAQSNLAGMYRLGRGVAADARQAAAQVAKSVASGDQYG
jgi:hypothetical protein